MQSLSQPTGPILFEFFNQTQRVVFRHYRAVLVQPHPKLPTNGWTTVHMPASHVTLHPNSSTKRPNGTIGANTVPVTDIRKCWEPTANFTLVGMAASHSPGPAVLSAWVAPPSKRPVGSLDFLRTTEGTKISVVPVAHALGLSSSGFMPPLDTSEVSIALSGLRSLPVGALIAAILTDFNNF